MEHQVVSGPLAAPVQVIKQPQQGQDIALCGAERCHIIGFARFTLNDGQRHVVKHGQDPLRGQFRGPLRMTRRIESRLVGRRARHQDALAPAMAPLRRGISPILLPPLGIEKTDEALWPRWSGGLRPIYHILHELQKLYTRIVSY